MTGNLSSMKVGIIIEEFNSIVQDKDGVSHIVLLRVKQVLVLQVKGKLTNLNTGSLLEKLQPLCSTDKVKKFVVDLSQCASMTSSVVGFIIFFMMQLKGHGGKSYLVKPSEGVVKMLHILNVGSIYELRDSVDEVLEAQPE